MNRWTIGLGVNLLAVGLITYLTMAFYMSLTVIGWSEHSLLLEAIGIPFMIAGATILAMGMVKE